MSDEPEQLEHRKRERWGVGCAVAGLLLVYILSPPFVWIAHAKLGGSPGSGFQAMIRVVYFPLGFVSEHLGFVNDFYRWYVSLFPQDWYEYTP